MLDDAAFQVFRARFVQELSDARAAGVEQINAVLGDYLRTGYTQGCVGAELTDWLCVDTPSILDAAGYPDESQNAIVQTFDQLHHQMIKALKSR